MAHRRSLAVDLPLMTKKSEPKLALRWVKQHTQPSVYELQFTGALARHMPRVWVKRCTMTHHGDGMPRKKPRFVWLAHVVENTSGPSSSGPHMTLRAAKDAAELRVATTLQTATNTARLAATAYAEARDTRK